MFMNFCSGIQKTFKFYDISELEQKIPNLITSLRIVVLPHLIYSFNHGLTPVVLALFLFGVSTDLIDGYTARKLKAQTKTGAYLDVTVDFIFIAGMYLAFTANGLYPPLILIIITAIFAQFIITNIYSKKTIYDPIGKYYGTILFCGIGVTLLFQAQIIYTMVTIGIITSTTISIISRTWYFLHTNPKSR